MYIESRTRGPLFLCFPPFPFPFPFLKWMLPNSVVLCKLYELPTYLHSSRLTGARLPATMTTEDPFFFLFYTMYQDLGMYATSVPLYFPPSCLPAFPPSASLPSPPLPTILPIRPVARAVRQYKKCANEDYQIN